MSKGIYIPDITVEMFRNAPLEGVEELLVSGVMRDIEVSEDAISRADLIKELRKDAERVEMEEFANDTVWRTIGNAPSVIPSRRKGHWVGEADGYADGYEVYDRWYCDCCDSCIEDVQERLPNFCPNCGADMRGASNG